MKLDNIRVEEDNGLYASYCDKLELYGGGATEEEAINSCINAIVLYCSLLKQRHCEVQP